MPIQWQEDRERGDKQNNQVEEDKRRGRVVGEGILAGEDNPVEGRILLVGEGSLVAEGGTEVSGCIAAGRVIEEHHVLLQGDRYCYQRT